MQKDSYLKDILRFNTEAIKRNITRKANVIKLMESEPDLKTPFSTNLLAFVWHNSTPSDPYLTIFRKLLMP